jgi:Brp/Blh family beta-carotene 15,15'-monooxygenase
VFFVASAWHFGQEEADLTPGQRGAKLLRQAFRMARGGLVIWVPVALQTDEVVRILSLTAPRGFALEIQWAVDALKVCSWVMLALAGVAWGWQALLAIASEGRRRRILLLDTFMVASLVLLFAWVNPVVGFLIYFCGWHSARGLRRLRRELGESWRQLAASLAPLTALTIGLVALTTCLVLRAPNWNDTLIRATFVGLSAVALPHLVLHGAGPVIDQMSRNRSARTVELRGAV